MSTYALGGRAGWRAASTSGLDVTRTLTATGSGSYTSTAFDGQTAGCRWDRVSFELQLPAGTSVSFLTYTADTDRGAAAIAALDPSEWAAPVTIQGPYTGWTDMLVRSAPGRYLWLQITLAGTAAASAELRRLAIAFPRNTSLRFLPAIYSTDAGGRDFNERLLSLFDAMRDQIKGEIRALAQVIDPRTTDARTQRDFLDWLGTWFNVELYRAWPIERRRAVIHHAGELFRLRGTARGIELFIELALGQKIFIVESFVDRHWWFASRSLLGCSVLFGSEIVGRAALDGADLLSTMTIDSVPTPMLDPFAIRANRMTVYVPCYAEPTEAQLTMLQEVINVQKPAHVAACIVLAAPEGRLGVTARLGLDAVTGELEPPAILAGSAPLRLGVNATLGGRP
ncbi:MAG: phage tail protein [Candidatus Lustribacter sp.]|jgi:phage tail-like protein